MANDLQEWPISRQPQQAWIKPRLEWIFPEGVCRRSREHSVLEKYSNAELNVWGLSQWTLQISPIHEIAQLKMCLCCSITAPAVSSACWFYVVDVGSFLFFFSFFICLFAFFFSRKNCSDSHSAEHCLWNTIITSHIPRHQQHPPPTPSEVESASEVTLWINAPFNSD